MVSRPPHARRGTLAVLLVGVFGILEAKASQSEQFDVFTVTSARDRLPPELGSLTSTGGHYGLLTGAERTLRIRWAAREGRSLASYRITAAINGGVLDGVAAQWILKPEPIVSGALQNYELTLTVPVGPCSTVTTALEAIGKGGVRQVALHTTLASWPSSAQAESRQRFDLARSKAYLAVTSLPWPLNAESRECEPEKVRAVPPAPVARCLRLRSTQSIDVRGPPMSERDLISVTGFADDSILM